MDTTSTTGNGPLNEKDTYKGPRHTGEYERLRIQHELVKINMGDKLVLAPIDFSNPHLRVLDSATADGYWLADLAQSLSSTSRLIGADISPQHFLGEKPANVELVVHNIFDSWPEDYQNYFDLVHQRFVLPVCNDEKSVDAIGKLFACVKAGGYIQLHDGDMETILEGPEYQAMQSFRDTMAKAWKMMGHNLSPGPKLVDWLQQAGATESHETIIVNKCGPLEEDEAQSERAISVLLALLDGAQVLLGTFPGFPSAQELSQLRVDLEKELRTVGNCWRTHVVVARKDPQTEVHASL
ncbi:hypothetical protein EAE99_003765 [Botrytis elliptica]|nr:hypothetical protein EAE99_003765 [Botrytis elliptica]